MAFLTSLDVLIGLIVIYLVLSLGVTVCNEWIDTVLLTRAKFLKSSIEILLGNQTTALEFYDHPIIKALCRGRNKYPTYIAPTTFREVLFTLLHPQAAITTLDDWLETVKKLPEGSLKIQLVSLTNRVNRSTATTTNQLDAIEKQIDDWFKESMERTTDWYKRRVQLWTFLTAMALTIGLNVDTIGISRYLFNDSTAREVYVQTADQILKQTSPDSLKRILNDTVQKDSTKTRQQLNGLITHIRAELTQNTTLPLGWQSIDWPSDAPGQLAVFWLSKLLGFLLTIAAISAGAPFWFDTLKNVMTIRNAIRQFTVDNQQKP